MSKTFNYNGYMGSIDFDTEDMLIHGKILFINDVVTYQADDIVGLKSAFEDAVDDYLETCELLGKLPDKPLKGSFNVRIGPDLHKDAARSASQEGVSLNDWVKLAIETRLTNEGRLTTKVEHHHHAHYYGDSTKHPLVTGSFDSSEEHWEPATNVVQLSNRAAH